MSQNDDNAGVGDGLSARQGGQEISICEHHQKQRCWFGMKCIRPHSLEIEEIERAKRCQRRFELKKKGGKRWQRSNPRILSMRFNSLEATVHNAIEGMREELQAVRVAVTEEDRFKKLEAENKRLEHENALLKKEKLKHDKELEDARRYARIFQAKMGEARAELGKFQAEKEKLQDSLRQSRNRCSNLHAYLKKHDQPIDRLLVTMSEDMCGRCEGMAKEALEDLPGMNWSTYGCR
mmetsp:Transcript_29963/g.48963  ORF Transcript_29963/g.48963 Transcript_29963/m.48963 type:complete len:236 (+) Transcript_29963:165-872(+)